MEADPRNPAQPLPIISWEMLEKSLAHSDASIREKAIDAGSRLADDETLPALQRAANDEDERVRTVARQAILALAANNPETDVTLIFALTNALRANSALMREAAAWALQQTGDVRSVPALVDALCDPEESVRRSAAVGLAKLAWPPTTETEQAAQLVALGRWEAAVELGGPAVDALIQCARQSTPATQTRAIQCLAETKSVRALQPLQELLSAPDRSVRQATARALKSLEWVPNNDAQAVAHAIQLEDWPAAAALGQESVSPLVSALKTAPGEPARRTALIDALCSIRDGAAARALTALCRDGEVATAAVQALSNLLEHQLEHIPAEALAEIAALQNVVQFQFTLDPRQQRLTRSGLEFINTANLRARAEAELARRSPPPAGAATP